LYQHTRGVNRMYRSVLVDGLNECSEIELIKAGRGIQ